MKETYLKTCKNNIGGNGMTRFLFIALVAATLGCSYPVFEHPIIKPSEAKRFEELYGVYQSKHPDNGEISWLHIGSCQSQLPIGFHKFVWVSPPSPANTNHGMTVWQNIGFLFRKDDSYILQVPFTKDCRFEDQSIVVSEQWGKAKIEHYCLVRFLKQRDELRLSFLDFEKIESLIENGELAGRIEKKNPTRIDDDAPEKNKLPAGLHDSVIVTAKSAELKRFFLSNDLDEIFDTPAPIFTRYDAK